MRTGALRSRDSWLFLAHAALVAAAYFVAARLSLSLAVPPGYSSPVWPPSGIALAALLMAGTRVWPAIWIGSFAANVSIEGAWLASLLIASGSAAQGVLAAVLVRRYAGLPYRFAQVRQVVKFVGICLAASTVAPTASLIPLSLGHALAGTDLFWNWWIWWQGDATGMLVIAPLVLSWAAPDTVAWNARRAVEAVAFWAVLVVAVHVVFGLASRETGPYSTTFSLVPLVVWAAFSFRQRGVTTATTAICAMALWYTLMGTSGPFSREPLHEALVLLLAFMSTLVVTGLVLCAVLNQLDTAMSELRGRQAELEARVRERTSDLEEANRRLRLMVDSVVDYAIFRLDTEGRISSWNAGAQRIKGYSSEEIIGRSFACFYPAEEAARGKPRRALEIAAREGRFQEEGWRVRKDGSPFWASVVISAVRDEKGQLLGFAKVTRDLTERNRADAELVRAKEAAERANEAKSQFLANMSHELRTPLNSLLILARLLTDNPGGNLTPKQIQFARTIYASGTDLLTLINDLLDLAKIESGAGLSVHFAPVRLEEIRDEIERTFRQVAHDRALQFSIELDGALPETIRTDGARLLQVLKNLLANAFKFTKSGGVRLRIAPAPGAVEFAVTDTGIGVPLEKQRMIFEAFQQADGTTSRQYGGTGLGLSISRELTRLLGGEIRLQSEPARGSTFTLRLPLAEA